MRISIGVFEIILRKKTTIKECISNSFIREDLLVLAKSKEVKNLFAKSDFCEFAYDDDQDQDYRCWLYKCICFDRTCGSIIKLD